MENLKSGNGERLYWGLHEKKGDSSAAEFPGRRAIAAMQRAIITMLAVFAWLSTANADPQPTATEIFHLRTECGKLGDNIVKNWTSTISTYSHYSKYFTQTNRCYVLITATYYDFKSIALYIVDAQSGEQIETCSHNDKDYHECDKIYSFMKD